MSGIVNTEASIPEITAIGNELVNAAAPSTVIAAEVSLLKISSPEMSAVGTNATENEEKAMAASTTAAGLSATLMLLAEITYIYRLIFAAPWGPSRRRPRRRGKNSLYRL